MKIVVLAGGTSTERSVSITSGTMVCKALREKNHQAVLVDVFCGIDVKGNLEDVFAEEAYDIDKAAEYMHSFDAGLNEMIESRRRFFGPNVLELCEAADVVFLALHGANGEDGKVQATFDLLGIATKERHPNIGILFTESGQQSRQDILRQGRTCSQANLAGQHSLFIQKGIPQFAIQCQNTIGIAKQPHTIIGQRNPVPMPQKERTPQQTFQLIDLLGDSWLRDQQLGCSLREAQPIRHRLEYFESEVRQHIS